MSPPRSARLFSIALLCVWPTVAQYVGSGACAPCHAAEYKTQSASPHAHALAATSPKGSGEWAFGAGVKAVTYVSRTGEDAYVERGRSYYSRSHTFGPTPGHPDGADLPYPALAAAASVARCFRCHSTGSLRLGAGSAIEPSENGVGCEACHGPGARHIAAGGDASLIGNPARLNAVELNRFCGVCHRTPPEPDEVTEDKIAVAARFDWSNPWNVRHQPAYLSQSACFRSSGGALSCLSCHNPHAAAGAPLAEYDRRCTVCHTSVKHQVAITKACVQCHMPGVPATAEMQFADHWIGVYGATGATAPVYSTRQPPPLSLTPTHEGEKLPANDPSTLRPLFEQELGQRSAQFGPKSPEAARSAWLLGAFLRELGTPEAAEKPLREALAADRENASPRAPEDAMELAQALQAQGKREAAIAFYIEAARGPDTRTSARSYASLARLDPSNAPADYAKAVAAEEAASGKDSPRVAALLSNYALALRAKGQMAQAETMLRRALQIQEKTFGPGHLQSAVSMNNLASVLQSAGKLAEAESLQRAAVAIFERKLPHSLELAAAYANLAGQLIARQDRVAAIPLLRLAIAADQAAGGPRTLEEAGDRANLARLLQQSDPADAESLFKEAIAIYEARLGPASGQARELRKALAQAQSAPRK